MKINKNKTGQIRQGDVLLVPITSIPFGLKLLKKCTFALGEVTGHHHTIETGDAVAFADGDGELADYAETTSKNAVLTHQEHDAIKINGKYKKAYQVNYTPEAIKPVAD